MRPIAFGVGNFHKGDAQPDANHNGAALVTAIPVGSQTQGCPPRFPPTGLGSGSPGSDAAPPVAANPNFTG